MQCTTTYRALERSELLVVSLAFGFSGQPWLWRQVVGLRGFRTEVVCWKRFNTATYPASNVSVRVLAQDPTPYEGGSRWWYRLRNLPGRNFYATVGQERRQLTELVREKHPAVILCYFGEVAMRLLPVALSEGIPLVAYFHGDFQFLINRWFRWSLHRCLPRFAAIIVVTEAERDWMLTHGVPADKIHIIPCGAPVEVFRPRYDKPNGPVRFVMVSRLVIGKGCDFSIRAFARIGFDLPGSELHIYGDGPARQDLERLVEAQGLKSRIFFHGYVEEQQLAGALASYDIFIQHSLWGEGSPVSIAEAMACGLPVVATPIGGITDQIVDGKTGLLIPERDVQGMAAAMLRLACDSELQRSFGQNARDRAVKLYDSSGQTRRLEQLLLAVAHQKHPNKIFLNKSDGHATNLCCPPDI
jgi:glycosyltransferase involved in cell wall biosynthesis